MFTVGILYFSYEILTGVLVIRREHFYKKSTYIPPTLFFMRDRERYLEWREHT